MSRFTRKHLMTAVASLVALTATVLVPSVASATEQASPQDAAPEFNDTFCGFLDVPYDRFFTDAACYLLAEGITTGTSPSAYSPSGDVTRAQMAAFLWRSAGSPAAPNKVFRDEASIPSWARTATDWLWAQGITDNDPYNPQGKVNRAQMAAFLWRAAGSPAAPDQVFADEASIPSFARVATDWLWAQGITTNDPYNPTVNVTRAQMAAFLWRADDSPEVTNPAPADAMTLWVDTTRSAGRTVAITLGDGDATINWGDGTTDQVTTARRVSHTFPREGYFMVTITGQTNAFGERLTVLPGAEKLVAVSGFGDLGIANLDWSFPGAVNLARMTRNLPVQVDTLEGAFGNPLYVDPFRAKILSSYVASLPEFSPEAAAQIAAVKSGEADPATLQSVTAQSVSPQRDASLDNTNPYKAQFSGDVSEWDVSQVDDFAYMFIGETEFTGDLSDWDTSNAIWMEYMFSGASSFTSDLSGWDVSNVVDMSNMFADASSFTSDLSAWNVGNVTNMQGMFGRASSFTSDLSGWDTSNVTTMQGMFVSVESFTSDLSGWNTSNVVDMSNMFGGARAFDSDLSGWNTSNVTNMSNMFSGAVSFTGNVSTWNTSKVTDMRGMFASATSFTSDLSAWNVSNVTTMSSMFANAPSFTSDLSAWNVSNVTRMQEMFAGNVLFNSDLSGWNVSNVTNARGFANNTPSWVLPKPNFLVDATPIEF